MFDTLVESRPRPRQRQRGAFGAVTLSAHLLLVAVALRMTARAAPVPASVVELPPYRPPVSSPTAPGPLRRLPDPTPTPDGGWQLPVPNYVPDSLPPIDAGGRFEPRVPGVSGSDSGPALGPGAPGLYSAAVVEDRPELLAGPPIHYPELLRQAGIEGRVVVELIVDTLGLVEPGSVHVVSSPQVGFNGPASAYASAVVFRPGRMVGRAVRVLVRLPIEFRLRR